MLAVNNEYDYSFSKSGGYLSNSPEFLELPGLVDLHVHLREPSNNKAETIASGTRAALLGGYALIADMPNNPGNPTWTESAMIEKHSIALRDGYIPVGFYAGWQPETQESLDELSKLSSLAVGLKLYGAPTTGNDNDYEARDFKPAISVWHEFAPNKPIMFHAGKSNLKDMIQLVAKDFGHSLHVCHVNSTEEVQLVKQVREAEGLQVTCGVCPHHLIKTSHDVHSEGWFARMQPPLANQSEAEELMQLLARGDIQVVETDHAPHSERMKWRTEKENIDGVHDPNHTTCFGVPGIEFAAPLLFNQAKRGRISMERVIDAMSSKPAEILGIKLSPYTKFVWDMQDYRIEEETSTVQSSARWTPYLGKLVTGVVNSAYIRGKQLMNAEAIHDQYPFVITERGQEI